MFCAAAVTLVPVLITLCFAARAAVVRFSDSVGVMVVVVRVPVDVVVTGDVGAFVALRLRAARADVDVVVAVVALSVRPRAVVGPPVPPPVRNAASAPNPVIKNANIKRILFNGNPPIIYIILS